MEIIRILVLLIAAIAVWYGALFTGVTAFFIWLAIFIYEMKEENL